MSGTTSSNSTIIQGFLYDFDFVNNTSITSPVLEPGSIGVLSLYGISYFANPQEIIDPRTSRGTNLNATFNHPARVIIDETIFPSFISDMSAVWDLADRQNLFALLDYLFFAYNSNNTPLEIEQYLGENIPQYIANSYVLSNSISTATIYTSTPTVEISVPNYITFEYKTISGSQYTLKIFADCNTFTSQYPYSTIAVVVPPLPIQELYTLDIVNGNANIFSTSTTVSTLSQQTLQTYIQSGKYSSYISQNIAIFDTNGNSTTVQFNLLYNGNTPSPLAVRTAILNLVVNSGVGTSAGWKARMPSLFVSELFRLIPLWEYITNQISSNIYRNIIPYTILTQDATTILFDIPSNFILVNSNVMMSYYDNIFLVAVPDTQNTSTRLNLINEHPTYQAVAPTNPAFNYQAQLTQEFSSLLASALSYAAGNPNNNAKLSLFTATGDTRTYVTFSVGDVEYYVITQASYMNVI